MSFPKLFEEKARLEAELEMLTTRLGGINNQLQRLGYQATEATRSPGRPVGEARKPRSASTRMQDEYTIKQHLAGKRPPIIELFHGLSRGIRALGEDVRELPRRHYIVYRTARNFCEDIV